MLKNWIDLAPRSARVLVLRQPTYCDVVYRGLAADLIALGAATPEMLAPGRRGRTRLTAGQHRFWRQHDKRSGEDTIRYLWLPHGVAERLPGVPRTWRSVVAPLLELTDEQRKAFNAEGGGYREADAA